MISFSLRSSCSLSQTSACIDSVALKPCLLNSARLSASSFIFIIITFFPCLIWYHPYQSHRLLSIFFISTRPNDFCKSQELAYTRYIDDVSLSSNKDFKNSLAEIIKKITDVGFMISPSKTAYRHIIDVIGISLGYHGMKPNQKFFDKLNETTNEASKKGRLDYLNRVLNA